MWYSFGPCDIGWSHQSTHRIFQLAKASGKAQGITVSRLEEIRQRRPSAHTFEESVQHRRERRLPTPPPAPHNVRVDGGSGGDVWCGEELRLCYCGIGGFHVVCHFLRTWPSYGKVIAGIATTKSTCLTNTLCDHKHWQKHATATKSARDKVCEKRCISESVSQPSKRRSVAVQCQSIDPATRPNVGCQNIHIYKHIHIPILYYIVYYNSISLVPSCTTMHVGNP